MSSEIKNLMEGFTTSHDSSQERVFREVVEHRRPFVLLLLSLLVFVVVLGGLSAWLRDHKDVTVPNVPPLPAKAASASAPATVEAFVDPTGRAGVNVTASNVDVYANDKFILRAGREKAAPATAPKQKEEGFPVATGDPIRPELGKPTTVPIRSDMWSVWVATPPGSNWRVSDLGDKGHELLFRDGTKVHTRGGEMKDVGNARRAIFRIRWLGEGDGIATVYASR